MALSGDSCGSCDQTGEIVAGNVWCLWLPISANPGPSTNRTRFSEAMVLNHPLNKMAQQQQFREKNGLRVPISL